MLFTEDWFGDGMSWQWSYYGALMSSATQLAAKHDGTRDFGGYVCLRGADALGLGGMVEGAILRRVISLFSHGAKAVHYFLFGPEFLFPGNGYSDLPYHPGPILDFITNQQ